MLTLRADIAVDGKLKIPAHNEFTYSAEFRMGIDVAISREFVLCFYMPDDRTEHGIFCVFHRFSGIQQRSLCVCGLQLIYFQLTPISSTKWGVPRMTLTGYLRFWCLMSYGVTLWLIFFKKEASLIIYVLICLGNHSLQDKELNKDEMSIKAVYKTIWSICKLPRISSFFRLQSC
jgi:hypothetical protein